MTKKKSSCLSKEKKNETRENHVDGRRRQQRKLGVARWLPNPQRDTAWALAVKLRKKREQRTEQPVSIKGENFLVE